MRISIYSFLVILCMAFPLLALEDHADEFGKRSSSIRLHETVVQDDEDQVQQSEWLEHLALAQETLNDSSDENLRSAYRVYCENVKDGRVLEHEVALSEAGSFESFRIALQADLTQNDIPAPSSARRYRIASIMASIFADGMVQSLASSLERAFDSEKP